jgi:hypothetical protein
MNKVIINQSDDFCRLVNQQLTHKLIRLHAKGYDLDFSLLKNKGLCCLQSGQCFDEECVCVTLVDQVYDVISNSYKYLHTVDAANGEKGLLLMEGIYHLHLKVAMVSVSFTSALQHTA